MLWNPPNKKNISRSLQPKWKGPWVIKEIRNNTNCCLLNSHGEQKYVHLNQLKKISAQTIHQELPLNDKDESTEYNIELESISSDILELLDNDDVIPEANEREQHTLINQAHVDIDLANILPERTRSKR